MTSWLKLMCLILAYSIVPPSSAASVTFTAPLTGFPTYSSAVPTPASSGAPARTVAGPPGDTNCDGSNQWRVVYGPSILGCLPSNVGVSGGTTPSAVPPPGWTGVWTNPVPPFVSQPVLQIFSAAHIRKVGHNSRKASSKLFLCYMEYVLFCTQAA